MKRIIYNAWGEDANGFVTKDGKTVERGTKEFDKIMEKWRKQERKLDKECFKHARKQRKKWNKMTPKQKERHNLELEYEAGWINQDELKKALEEADGND